MMRVWVHMVRYSGDLCATTHLTEKGAVLAGIKDILEYYDIHDDEDMKGFVQSRTIRKDNEYPVLPWDREEMQKMDKNTLYGIYSDWCEYTWDDFEYEADIVKTVIQG